MKSTTFLSVSLVAGAILFDVLFRNEGTGLNLFIFSGFLAGAMLTIYPEKIKSVPVKVTLVGTLISAAAVVINHSDLSLIVHFFSMLAFIGFVHHEHLRFAGSALTSNFFRWFELPVFYIEKLLSLSGNKQGTLRVVRFLKLAVVPGVVLLLFFQIYSSANSKFAELSRNMFSFFDQWGFKWFSGLSFEHLVFLGLGLFFTSWALVPARFRVLEDWEANQDDTVVRKKPMFKGWFFKSNSMVGLRNEYRSALMLIGSLNILLFIVNMVDVRYVWFGSRDLGPALLSQYVHEGTWLLIFSILLAMSILFFYFRGNLNFFKENRWLKLWSFVWIAQNALLACSVAVRNFQYVDYYGLAYKRIGVGIFLVITLAGLATMVLKVNEKKSIFYLLRLNSWSIYLVLVLSCLVNWDILITRYNLNAETKAAIDTNFLIYDVSDKNVFLLENNRDKLTLSDHEIADKLRSKKERLFARIESRTWLSWNLPDFRNKRYFSKQ